MDGPAGSGSVEGRLLQLLTPAVVTAEAGGWRIAPTGLRFAGVTATVGGRTGADPQLTA